MTSTIIRRVTGATALGAVVTSLVLLLLRSRIEPDGAVVDEPSPGHTLTCPPALR